MQLNLMLTTVLSTRLTKAVLYIVLLEPTALVAGVVKLTQSQKPLLDTDRITVQLLSRPRSKQ